MDIACFISPRPDTRWIHSARAEAQSRCNVARPKPRSGYKRRGISAAASPSNWNCNYSTRQALIRTFVELALQSINLALHARFDETVRTATSRTIAALACERLALLFGHLLGSRDGSSRVEDHCETDKGTCNGTERKRTHTNGTHSYPPQNASELNVMKSPTRPCRTINR
jgi:hypothetical protein